MCKLVSILACKCEHALKIEYKLCHEVPTSQIRCPTMISSIDGSCLDAHTPFCPKCVEEMKTRMIANFHEERREMTRVARAEEWTDGDISAMRVELRDQLYERLKYVNKPLPALPDGEGSARGRR